MTDDGTTGPTKGAITMHFSPIVAAKERPLPGFSGLQFIDLAQLGVADSPVSVLDDFRVPGLPFSPHPHAGFAAVTYVFEDSPGGVRSRASNGVDLVLGPGAIIWTHADSGIAHEEIPAEPGVELHGVQIFVNLSAKGKLTEPEVHYLEPDQVPEWQGDDDDRVRVVVGSFAGVSSPLVPLEPFTLLDAFVMRDINLDVPADHNAVVYVMAGSTLVGADRQQVEVAQGHALALGGGGRVSVQAARPAHVLLLSGRQISDPVVSHGPFIMNDQSQIQAAIARFEAGAMGRLDPLP
jgi:redox-sensitive bicupin YhaK (pirin superfamily)